MWEVKEGTSILIYAPHDVINGPRTIYTKGESKFDHYPYKTFITRATRQFHEIQVRSPSQVAAGKADVPEWAFHEVINQNYYVICNRNRRNRRCYALVKPSDIKFVGDSNEL
jgi:hypothetical protein